MIIQTKFLGQIELDEKDVILFEKGIPGFEDLKKFTFLPMEDNAVMYFLQSVENDFLCFIVVSPFVIEPDYDIELNADVIGSLEIEKPEDVQLFAIMNIAEKLKDSTVNLRAPLVVNLKNNKGVQVVLDNDKYHIKHKLIKED